jgi:hypothetical protein
VQKADGVAVVALATVSFNPYGRLADAVLVLHFAFVAFVVLGGFLVWRRRRLAWLHLPLTLWGVLAATTGIVCPLTPLENTLRQRAGQPGYAGGFLEHYLTATLYPEGLTRAMQFALGILLLLLNLTIYVLLLLKRSRREQPTGTSAS